MNVPLPLKIIGDIHGNIEEIEKSKTGTIIIAGDSELLNSGSYQEHLRLNYLASNKDRLILIILGNHDNPRIVEALPEAEWNGGKVNVYSDNLLYLRFGEIYNFSGSSFFILSGGFSRDRWFRKSGINYWAEELPSKAQISYALSRIKDCGHKVDYIISHCAPMFACNIIKRKIYPEEEYFLSFLQGIYVNTNFFHWYAAHEHVTKDINCKLSLIYNKSKAIIK